MNEKNIQQNWFDLIKSVARETETETKDSEAEQLAKKQLAQLLRQIADQVEAEGFPAVYGYYYVKDDGPFTEIKVVLSNPWGG